MDAFDEARRRSRDEHESAGKIARANLLKEEKVFRDFSNFLRAKLAGKRGIRIQEDILAIKGEFRSGHMVIWVNRAPGHPVNADLKVFGWKTAEGRWHYRVDEDEGPSHNCATDEDLLNRIGELSESIGRYRKPDSVLTFRNAIVALLILAGLLLLLR
jgi:hypothetical protein